MQLTTAFLAATAAATIALAAPPKFPPEVFESPVLANLTTGPVNDNTVALNSKRAELASATYCEHSMHTTPCASFSFIANQCYNLPPYWNDKMSSIFPTSRTDRCDVWTDSSCTGRSLTVTWPGVNRLADKDMNDQVSSIRCYKFGWMRE